jgi:hypothetical protein
VPRRQRRRKSADEATTATSQPTPRVQTRSQTLKRDREAVEADPQKKKLFEAFEPLTKKAKVAVAASVADKPKRSRSKKESTESTQTKDNNAAIATLDDEDKKQLTMVFNMADIDKDGRLDIFELEAVLRNLGFRPTIQEVSQILREGDTDNSGTLELNEFLALMARVKPEEGEESEKQTKDEQQQKMEVEQESTPKTAKRRRRSSSTTTKKTKTRTSTKEKGVRVSRLQRGNSALTLPNTNTTLKLNRGLSITDFYTNYAGQHDIPDTNKDTFSNPEGREFDLGREGAFKQFVVVVGLFCPHFTEPMFM